MRAPIRQLLVAVLTFLALSACAGSTTGGAGRLVVQQDGRVLSRLTLSQLTQLPQVEIATPQSRGAQIQKGPTVRNVLNAAGATGIGTVRVEGRDPAQTLSSTELTDQLVLNVTRRNTLKLTGTQLARDRWVRDVTTLVVNP